MSEDEIRQRAALEGQRGGRRGQEGWPIPPYRASWSTEDYKILYMYIAQGHGQITL